MTTGYDLSVVICAHSPRPEYLGRVLDALRTQTMPASRWELLLIDNASREKLADRFDLSWHPNARHVSEDELGLTPARLRGIAEARADLLVFVDDDNVLDANYLETARGIADGWPVLGTWGGQCLPEYEREPAEDLKPYVGNLALRTLTRDTWSNFPEWCDSHPFGAGMCVRRQVLEEFAREVHGNERLRNLGRQGANLSSHEDYFINRISCRTGFGCGTFQSLKLTHLIPAGRVTEEYLLRLIRGFATSSVQMNSLEGIPSADPFPSRLSRWKRWLKIRLRVPSPTARRFEWASLAATSAAVRKLRIDLSE